MFTIFFDRTAGAVALQRQSAPRHPRTRAQPPDTATARSRTRAAVGAVLALVLLGTAGCAGDSGDPSEVRTVTGFAGAVAADEPRAALVGRDVLGRNATAADAAVAMAFAMTVTLPSRVGVGGGGACVAHGFEAGRTEAILFLPRLTDSGAMIPGLPRGMAALQARYGVRDWRQLVAPAEQLARFGHKTSRAFRRDLEAGAGRLAPEAREKYRTADGDLPEVGEQVRHEALSTTLAGLRRQGAGYLYVGDASRRFAEAASTAGPALSSEDLAGYRAETTQTLTVPFGNHALHTPPPPLLGGLTLAQHWAMLRRWGEGSEALTADSAHFDVEAWKRVLSERRRWRELPADQRPDPQSLLTDARLEQRLANYDPGAATPAARLQPQPTQSGAGHPTAGFAVADRFGNMVACSFTMNGLFGRGVEAGGSGVLLAGAASPALTGAGLAPVVIANAATGSARFAVSAADGKEAQTALTEMLRAMRARRVGGIGGPVADLEARIAAPRVHHPGRPDVVRVEPDVPEAVLQGLRTKGHKLVKAPGLGRLQAVYCPSGARADPDACRAVADPRGNGLAVRAQ